MNLFSTKTPFQLHIFSNKEEWHSQSEKDTKDNGFPVFHQVPTTIMKHSFGLCVSSEDDIKAATDFFQECQRSEGAESQDVYFLYVMGDVCRQTDILKAATETPYPCVIEKGSFLAPDDVARMVAKIAHKTFALVECGSAFGYADRVLDPRSVLTLKKSAPYFGICVTDLLAPEGERYPHRAEKLSNPEFLDAFHLATKNFEPQFYVYKHAASFSGSLSSRGLTAGPNCNSLDPTVKPRDDKELRDSKDSPYTGWDGSITPQVQLTRHKLTILAGPCMLESLELGLHVGSFLKDLCQKLGFQYVFKSSFDKANRTSADGVRGPGLNQGLKWLAHIKNELSVPIITDVHNADQARAASEVADILQIPAFLFRDKKLLLACASTGKVLQIKKGQWASAQDMLNISCFLASHNYHKVILAERGSSFGYHNLVVDFRNLEDMAALGNAVVFDATHSVQLPGAKDGKSSGLRHMVPALTRAALAIGVDGLFMEVHPHPERALSDADTQLSFEIVSEILHAISTSVNI